MEMNEESILAWNIIEKTNANLFLTGKAGTGKTTFLKRLKELSPKRMIVLAPTGIAAINAGGMTIHSFFQLPFSPYVPGTTFGSGEQKRYQFSKLKRNIIRSIDLLVIDEISMVRSDLLDAVDSVLRQYRKRHDLPFGGVQLLMIGDLQQLAPVVMTNPGDGFVVDSLNSPGVLFAVKQAKYDKNYIITSISFARNLFGQQGMLSDLELRLKPGSNLDAVKAEMQQIAGNKYKVLDRFEQQEDTFKIMSIEKMIAYIFLTFILVVACFNIIGSLSMLIIDKKNDVVTLRNLGANDKQITRVFLFEGRMIAVIGAVIGIGLGLLLCFLQQQYGFVRLGDSEGSFIVDAYPVSVHYSDVAIIFVTVIAVGWLAVWYPVRALSKRLLS